MKGVGGRVRGFTLRYLLGMTSLKKRPSSSGAKVFYAGIFMYYLIFLANLVSWP